MSDTPQDNNTPIAPITHPSVDDLDDFFEGMDTSEEGGECLTADTVIGWKTSGKTYGKVEDLIKSLDTEKFHEAACCPFRSGPSPKGKGVSVTVNKDRTKLTLMCWAADDHNHSEEVTRYAADGRTYAMWTWGSALKKNCYTVKTDDQSVLADYVLQHITAKEGLLAYRDGTLLAYDKQAGEKKGGKSHAGCSPTWGAWTPCPPEILAETVRRLLAKTSIEGVDKDGNPTSRPVRVTVPTLNNVVTLLMQTVQVRERYYLRLMHKRGEVTFDDLERGASRFDFCTSTLLQPGVVLTAEAKQEIARPNHHVPSECRIGFGSDPRFLDEWTAYVTEMVPDTLDQKVLQMWVGAALVGGCATKLQKHIILKGPEGSGKTQLAELIGSIFPESQRSAIRLGDMHKQFTPAGLVGKRFNLSGEADTESGKLPDVGGLKLYLDGSPVQVERKNEQPYFARLTAAWMILANKLPAGDSGGALYDRFYVVRATEEKKRGTGAAITEWYRTKAHWKPAILHWAIEGLELLKAAEWRLPKSSTSEEERREWQEESDSILAWKNTLPAPPTSRSGWTPATAAYAAYAAWCKTNGRTGIYSSTKFGREMKSHARAERSSGGVFYAISLQPVDPVVQELFPETSDPIALFRAAEAAQDWNAVSTLTRQYPDVARRYVEEVQ